MPLRAYVRGEGADAMNSALSKATSQETYAFATCFAAVDGELSERWAFNPPGPADTFKTPKV